MSELLKNLNPEQEKAVTFDNGPLLIVAGAGTGKTTVITRRIAWLIETGRAKPEEILALTFTERAAGEMEERVDRLLPYGYLDLWISTFHSFGERILRAHGLDVGLPNEFRLLNETQQWLLIRHNLDRFDLDYYRPLGSPTKFIQALTSHFSRVKDEMISPEEYLKYAENLELDKDAAQDGLIGDEAARMKEVAGAFHAYQNLLLENNALDFGDLINYCLTLFKKRPSILERYLQQFKYILVDEFQDTNYAQYELIRLLAAPKNNLTVCADDDQAIYKFRGASVSNVLQFKKDYPKSEDVVLTKNYRSKQDILDLSYKFIQLNNPNRLEYQMNEAKNEKRKTQKNKLKISKKLEAQNKGKGTIECLFCQTQREEARKVAEKIEELQAVGEASWNDFAVLVRANSQADIFCQVLSQAGIPYQFMASAGLFAKPIILDTLSYLKLLDNYHESPAVFRILNLPFLGIGSGDLHEITHYSYKKGQSLYETLGIVSVLKLDMKAEAQIKKLMGWIEKHSDLARRSHVSAVILAFLEDSGYLKYLAEGKSREAEESLSYLNQFFRQAEEFERSAEDKSVRAFMEYMDLVIESGDKGSLKNEFEEGPEAVKVMTVHGSKGLEFKYVFIVNLVDLRFPTTERKDPIELPDDLVKEIIPEGNIHLEEERRLFYVAMTRAKEGLFLTLAEDYGGARKKKPSRFVAEAGFANIASPGEKSADGAKADFLPKTVSPKKKGKPGYVAPAKFSFSQIKAFEICPLQYKYTHLLRIPTADRATFSFGKAMHGALQQFFELAMERSGKSQGQLFGQGDKSASELSVSLEELLKIYESAWIGEWYGDKANEEKYRRKGRESLKNFYHDLETNGLPCVRFLEMGFNFKVKGETIKGRIDRIDSLEGGKLEITDYKTGQAKEKLDADDKKQLLIYQMAAEEILKEKVGRLTFHYLDENKKISFVGDEKDMDKLREKLAVQISRIKKSALSGEFGPTPGFWCKNCDFRGICEFRVL